jgi:RNA polymerase sigma-70 factor, ECF subfamily
VNEQDVEKLSRRYGPMVLRRCLRLMGSQDEAEDASQEVFLRLFERRERLNGEYPSSLLYRMATNLCLNRIRDRRRSPVTADERKLQQIACASDPVALGNARLLLDRLFGRHPESSRTMAVLHYVDGLTLAEVAAETGLSVSGVRKRLRGLRATLKEMNDEWTTIRR